MRQPATRRNMNSMPQSPVTRPPLPPLAKGGRYAPLRGDVRLGLPRRDSLQIRNPISEIQNRRGSVLIVVIGLLLVVMLIGITFFTFANQEHSSAEYYADSAKVYSISPDMTLFEMALEQLIIGPHDDNIQSVLYPGKYSLVPNELGLFGANPKGRSLTTIPLDRHPYTGGFGINIISGPQGQPILDQNFNGKDDALEGLPNYFDLIKNINLSGAVQLSPTYGISQASSRQQDFNNFPAIDVGYTYPDINNLFLAYIGNTSVPSPTVGNPPNVYSVITPSFIRPGVPARRGRESQQQLANRPDRGATTVAPRTSSTCAW